MLIIDSREKVIFTILIIFIENCIDQELDSPMLKAELKSAELFWLLQRIYPYKFLWRTNIQERLFRVFMKKIVFYKLIQKFFSMNSEKWNEYNYYHFTLWEFFSSPSYNWWSSMKSEWQQVFSAFQDSSKYSCWPQKCCGQNILYSSSSTTTIIIILLLVLTSGFSLKSKSPQVSWILRRILADLKSAVFLMVSLLPISGSYSLLPRFLRTVSRTSTSIVITVTFILISCSHSLLPRPLGTVSRTSTSIGIIFTFTNFFLRFRGGGCFKGSHYDCYHCQIAFQKW